MVRFGKNGSDVTAGAVRLARAITGREHLLVAGYHGWQDWYIGATSRNLGVPKSIQGLTHKFIYNDLDSLEALFKKYKNKVAGVVMEPMNYEEPKDNFLQKVKELTHKNRALLVFDEVITGFRWSLGGAQEYFGVVPDLACFGKSMANGMPVSALVGKKEYMKKVKDVFYSFTFGGEALSLAAAIATIKEMEKKKVIDYIWQKGKELKDKTMEIIRANCLEDVIQLKGKPCWTVFSISPTKGYSEMEIKSYLQQEILAQGFLWYGQHNLSFSHSQQDIEGLLKTYGKVLVQLKKLLIGHKLRENLRGKTISQIFKIR
jgi:glutamate-1-semialdehyde aminotransferase